MRILPDQCYITIGNYMSTDAWYRKSSLRIKVDMNFAKVLEWIGFLS